MADPLYRKPNDVMVLDVETAGMMSGLSVDAAQELGNLEFMKFSDD